MTAPVSALAGSFALAVALFGGLAAFVLWWRAARGARPEPAVQATWLMAAGAAGACAALEWALVGDDFSLRYVAENSSRATPLLYRVTALWSALDGSLLLWLLVLAAYASSWPSGARGLRPRPCCSRGRPW